MGQRVVPDETAAGIGHRVAAPVRIAPRPAAERFFDVVGDVRLVRPLVAVGAEHAAAIEVVEQHEIIDELVMVRRDIAAIDAQLGVAFAPLDVAEAPGRRSGSL